MNNDCLKLTTYFGERHRTEEQFVADALLDLYGRKEVEVERDAARRRGVRRSSTICAPTGCSRCRRTCPLVSVAVDTRARIEAMLDEVIAIKRHGLVTLERARMLTGEVGAVALPEELHEATKLTVYVGRQERVSGSPAFVAVCDLLHRRGHRRRDRAARRGRHGPRRAPASALLRAQRGGADDDHRGRRRRADRRACCPSSAGCCGARCSRSSACACASATVELLAPPTSLPATDEQGLAVWQKLMVYASEQARHGRSPLHVALVRRLRESGASGRDLPARGLGLPRRPPAARRSPAPAPPPRPGGDDHRRHARADRATRSRSSTS